MRSPSEIVSIVREYRSPKRASVEFDPDDILGIGAGRLIFNWDDETVLKASPNSMGDEQNETEVKIWTKISSAGQKYLAPIPTSAWADDFSWIKMKKVTNAEETYEAFETQKEEQIRTLLSGYGVTLHEVEVGYYNGQLVAFDYGSAEI